MAHSLSIQNGRAEMFSGRGINPWHGLGVVVEGLLSSKAALEAAHLDWCVEKRSVYVHSAAGTAEQVGGYKAIARADTGAVLSVMKDTYHPIQNVEAFEFFDSVVGEGQAVYDTAGALHGGRRVWIMARLPKRLFIEGDELERNLLLSTSHDGSSTMKMMQVTTRVVCQNTLTMALGNATNTVSILHRGNYKDRVAEAQRALKISYGYFDQLGELIKSLARAPFAASEMHAFTAELLPIEEGEKSPRTEKARGEIDNLFRRGIGNRGRTKYDALNAVTEYVDHHRTYGKTSQGGKEETRFASTLFGSGAKIKSRAVELLTA